MHTEKLVKMANQIASFFDAQPDRAVGLEGIYSHLKRFWEPRMRREIVRWVDEEDGAGLKESVIAAIRKNRDSLLPQIQPSIAVAGPVAPAGGQLKDGPNHE